MKKTTAIGQIVSWVFQKDRQILKEIAQTLLNSSLQRLPF